MSQDTTFLSSFLNDPALRYILVRREGCYWITDLRFPASYVLIEDDAVAQKTKQKMLEAGVPVFERCPIGPDPTADFVGNLIQVGLSVNHANDIRMEILSRIWELTDQFLTQGKSYPEITHSCADFAAQLIEKRQSELGSQ